MLLSPWYRSHKFILLWSEAGPVTELFYEIFWFVEFPRNVEGFYFFEVGIFSDMVSVEDDVFHPLYRDLCLTVHPCVVVIVTPGWDVEVNVWQLWLEVSDMLDHICEFVFGMDIWLIGDNTGSLLEEWFPCDSPAGTTNPGGDGNQTIPLRESRIQFPGTRIILLR